MTARVPAVYDAEDVDEMTLCALTVLAEARRRLTARYSHMPHIAAGVAGVLDAYAEEVADLEDN